MLSDEELLVLLRGGESDRVEFKEKLPRDRDKLRATICAFANDLPNHQQAGVIFIGAKDDGTCADLEISDGDLTALSSLAHEGKLLPFPSIEIAHKVLAGCPLVVVLVHPALQPPVRFETRIYVRIGAATQLASAEHERRLLERQRANNLPFDIRPLPNATLDDLDLDFFRRNLLPNAIAEEVLAENDRSLSQQLASLRLATYGTPPQPTTLGILACGKEPQRFLPGAYVQFVRYEGIDVDLIKDSERISGVVSEVAKQLDILIRLNITTAVDLSALHEVRVSDYPEEALRQIVINALLHRDYENTNAPVRIEWFADRVEITSPGKLYGRVTRENFGTGATDYRNKNLAEIMERLGLVQQFGVGLRRAKIALERNGNPPFELDEIEGFVRIIIRRRP
ncbi:MAG: transcriptional regulator [Chloroflexi bacterium CFX4]|nr:transcriptional regulator [Chloroflexi bacterium CFX4]